MELTQAELKKRIHYDAITGTFTNRRLNSEAGTITTNRNGYQTRRIKLPDGSYSAKVIAVLYQTGEIVHAGRIAHADANTLNFSWDNLIVRRPIPKGGITQEWLKSWLLYDPETGHFTDTSSGQRVGYEHHLGYRYIKFASQSHAYSEHRLAFFYMEGFFPPIEVDHINRIRKDNRWKNLRHATSSENNLNSGLRSDNTSGVQGVAYHKTRKRWEVAAPFKIGKSNFCGGFKNKEDAVKVRKLIYRIQVEYNIK